MKRITGSIASIQRLVRVVVKAFAFSLLVVAFISLASINDLIIGDRKRKLGYSSRLTSFFGYLCVLVLGIRVKVNDKYGLVDHKDGFLIVSNHLSYLDIFIISSVVPSIFVAGVDSVEQKFLLGTVTRLSGGIFVVRRNRSRVGEDLGKISSVLDMGFNVVLFPEGTTSNGESVLPFKSSFFASAMSSTSDLVPLCIKYTGIDGLEVNESNRDLIFYYEEEVDFFKHFFRMLGTSLINVELNFLEKISSDQYRSRKELSEQTYSAILNEYKN